MKITKNADDTFNYEIVDCDGKDRFFRGTVLSISHSIE